MTLRPSSLPAAQKTCGTASITLSSILCAIALPACATSEGLDQDGIDDSFLSGKADTGGVAEGTPEAKGVLALVNEASQATLDDDADLDTRAADNIVAHRLGDDRVTGTADDEVFDTLAELDAVPYVGPVALAGLLSYAQAQGYVVAPAPPGHVFPNRIRMNGSYIFTPGEPGSGPAVIGYTTAAFDYVDHDDRKHHWEQAVGADGGFTVTLGSPPFNGDRMHAAFRGPELSAVGCDFSYRYDGGAVYSLAETGCIFEPNP